MVSMWAAFGPIENIPPLAFAVPAMFAKSSTIYNPIVYLMLRPNFRRVMWRDLGALCHTCLKVCHCSQEPEKCSFKQENRVSLRTVPRQTKPFSSCISCAQPPMIALNGCSCGKRKNVFECFRHYRLTCGVANPCAVGDSPNSQNESLVAFTHTKRTSGIDNAHIHLEITPGYPNVA